MTRIFSSLVRAKIGLPKILILALVGDLAYRYDMWAANPQLFFNLYRILEKKKMRAHTLKWLISVEEKMREDQRA